MHKAIQLSIIGHDFVHYFLTSLKEFFSFISIKHSDHVAVNGK